MDTLTPEHVRSARTWRDVAGDVDPPSSDSDGATTSGYSSLLWRTVEREVIPRLLQAHRNAPHAALRVDRYRRPAATDVDGFVAALLSGDLTDALTVVNAERARGTRIDALCMNLLLPAANLLTRRWEAELCDYDDLAVGMVHLQQLLHELGPAFAEEGAPGSCGRTALMLSSPSETSVLGTYLITEFHRCLAAAFFEHAGWEVWRTLPNTRAQLLSVLRTQWFDVIGFAASCAERLAGVARAVTELRNASRNAEVRVIVSGPVFAAHPELAARTGADAVARDPRDLIAQAMALAATPPA